MQVHRKFHRVKQKPGKPFWFGTADRCVVFALPGNPNSSFVCTLRYVIPWVNKSLGLNYEPIYVELSENVSFKKPLTNFANVAMLRTAKGQLTATPVQGNGSGDFASLALGDGFIELPAEQELFSAGDAFKYFPYRK